MKKIKENEIYFNGQIYDTYSKIIDILSEAKRELQYKRKRRITIYAY